MTKVRTIWQLNTIASAIANKRCKINENILIYGFPITKFQTFNTSPLVRNYSSKTFLDFQMLTKAPISWIAENWCFFVGLIKIYFINLWLLTPFTLPIRWIVTITKTHNIQKTQPSKRLFWKILKYILSQRHIRQSSSISSTEMRVSANRHGYGWFRKTQTMISKSISSSARCPYEYQSEYFLFSTGRKRDNNPPLLFQCLTTLYDESYRRPNHQAKLHQSHYMSDPDRLSGRKPRQDTRLQSSPHDCSHFQYPTRSGCAGDSRWSIGLRYRTRPWNSLHGHKQPLYPQYRKFVMDAHSA